MKQIISLTTFLIFILFSSQIINATKTFLRVKTKIGTKVLTGVRTKQQNLQELKKMWGDLFKAQRGGACSDEVFKPDEKAAVDENLPDPNAAKSGWGLVRPSYRWIKKWGYGDVAYLIDYLDPVFREDFVTEVKTILKGFKTISQADNDLYKDAFNMKFIAPKGNSLATDEDFKAISKGFSKKIHEGSINTVQLNTALLQWSWYQSIETEDQAYDLVAKYDINGDGRLSPRELILADIWNNKKRDDLFCYNCFYLLARKLASMFSYLDCTGKGYLTAEDLWNKLPSLVRKTGKWNIFQIDIKKSIRTNCVNDFILKNGYTIDGGITKNEFVTGVLLGIWDRVLTDEAVLEDESKSLKELRWGNAGMHDLKNAEYQATLAAQK